VKLLAMLIAAVTLGTVFVAAQPADTAAAHRAVARNVGAKEWPELLRSVCPPAPPMDAVRRRRAAV
jgi:hypothetical protein